MSYSASTSEPSVSVVYGTAYAGLFYQQGREINYASLDRAGELVAQMPSSARRTLLAPIEQGLIDPQSVFYLIDDKSENKIAICVEDFIHLTSTCFSIESDDEQQQSSTVSSSEGDTTVPPRLLDALLLKSEADKIYSSIDNEGSSGYSSHDDQMRSRFDSAASQASISSTLPILPLSRPPARSFSVNVGSCSTQQRSEFKETDVFGKCYLSSEQLKSTVYSTPIHLNKFSLNSFVENIGKNVQGYTTRNTRLPACRFRLLIIISAGLTIMALAAGMYYLLQNPNRKEPLISTTASTKTFAPTTAPKTTAESTTSPKTTAATVTSMKTTVATTTSPRATSGATTFTSSNRTYDCVQGSITKLVVGGTLYQLADLKIPEQCPTLTVGSLEYLLVPRATSWWYAQKYCTAWCGYLVSIKDSDENAKILDMVKQNLSDIPINYWIGLKAWSNKWYLDDESDVKYFNFPNKTQADKDMFNINNMQMGCVLANSSGLWSLMNCDAPLPFVCERNTAENINRIPFAPYEEKLCQEAGGKCKWENDCGDDSHHKLHLCRDQPNNIQCCIPNNSIKTCADVGGICRHIDADQCRGGRVIFDLPIPCADGPRPYACCIENEHIS